MRFLTMKRALTGFGIISAALLGGISGARADAPATQPKPAVGDVFVYTGKYMSVACSTWTVTSINQNGYVISKCGNDTAYNLASNDDFVKITDGTGKVLVQFKPYFSGVQFPLSVGKSWEAKYSGYTDDDGNSWDSDQNCNVVSLDTVDVPAGSVPAYKMVCVDHWSSPPFKGSSKMNIWYSAQDQTVVKVTSPDSPKWTLNLKSETLH